MAIARYRYYKKKKRHSGKKFKQGYYIPLNPEKYKQPIDKTMNEGQYPFMRSSWEKKFAIWCDNNPEVKQWGCEVLHIPYYDTQQNKMRRYFPDFFVLFEDGSKWIIEIKPLKDYKSQNNIDKWKAADEYAKSSGSKFIVMNEYDLGVKTRK